MPVDHAPEQIVDGDRASFHLLAAALEPCQVEQITDDGFQLVRLLVRNAQISMPRLIVQRDAGHRQCLEIAADRGQRRHQFMRNVGEQLTTGAIGCRQGLGPGMEVVGHPVERARELGHLVAARFTGAHVGASLAKRARGLLETTEPLVRGAEDQECGSDDPDHQQAEAGVGERRTISLDGDPRRRTWRNGDDPDLDAVDDDGRGVQSCAWAAASSTGSAGTGPPDRRGLATVREIRAATRPADSIPAGRRAGSRQRDGGSKRTRCERASRDRAPDQPRGPPTTPARRSRRAAAAVRPCGESSRRPER